MNITIGDVLGIMGIIVTAAGTVSAFVALLIKLYSNTVGKSIKKSIEPLQSDITSMKTEMQGELEQFRDEFRQTVKELDASECRNFLVRFLGDIERGVAIDQVEIERAYDIMQHYSEDLKQNSYIHARWEQVMGTRTLAASIKEYSHNK